jgi:hypothetical protein
MMLLTIAAGWGLAVVGWALLFGAYKRYGHSVPVRFVRATIAKPEYDGPYRATVHLNSRAVVVERRSWGRWRLVATGTWPDGAIGAHALPALAFIAECHDGGHWIHDLGHALGKGLDAMYDAEFSRWYRAKSDANFIGDGCERLAEMRGKDRAKSHAKLAAEDWAQ